MSDSNFTHILRNQKIPWYVNFESDHTTFLKKYKTASLTLRRVIRTGVDRHIQYFKLTKDTQNIVFKNLCTMKSIYPYTIAISSEPTDYLAMNTAASIVYSLFKRHDMDFKFVNPSFKDKESSLYDYKVVVIHNIAPIEDSKRIYAIRDTILKYPKALKLVVVGGTNGIDFFDNYLYLPLSSTLHVLSGPAKNEYLKHKTKPTYESPIFTEEIESLVKPVLKKVDASMVLKKAKSKKSKK